MTVRRSRSRGVGRRQRQKIRKKKVEAEESRREGEAEMRKQAGYTRGIVVKAKELRRNGSDGKEGERRNRRASRGKRVAQGRFRSCEGDLSRSAPLSCSPSPVPTLEYSSRDGDVSTAATSTTIDHDTDAVPRHAPRGGPLALVESPRRRGLARRTETGTEPHPVRQPAFANYVL